MPCRLDIQGYRGCPVLGLALICRTSFARGRVFPGGGGIRRRGRGPETLKLVEGAVERALDAGFVAREGFDGAGAGGVVGEGAGARIEFGKLFVAGQLRDTNAEQSGFERAHAAKTPGGDGHLLDEQGFGGSGGAMFVEKGIAELAEFLGVLVGQNGGLGGEAVAQGIMGDGGAAFGSARAGGKPGVAAISVELTFGKHRFDWVAEADSG